MSIAFTTWNNAISPDANPAEKLQTYNAAEALAHTKTIVPNAKSRKYALKEMFEILNHMKQNNELLSQETDALYRNSTPSDILHLQIAQSSEEVKEPHDSVNGDGSASVSGSSSSTGGAASGVAQTVGAAGTVGAAENGAAAAISSESLLSRISSLPNPSPVPPQLGISPQASAPPPVTVPPEHINWYYLDPSNMVQGPFSGHIMHNWFSQGYLSTDLRIKRAEESHFYPLMDLIVMVKDQTAPFLVPLPMVVPLQPPQHLTQQQQQQQQQSMFGWNQRPGYRPVWPQTSPGTASGFVSPSNSLSVQNTGGSGFLNTSNSGLLVSQIFEPAQDSAIARLSSSVLGPVLGDTTDLGLSQSQSLHQQQQQQQQPETQQQIPQVFDKVDSVEQPINEPFVTDLVSSIVSEADLVSDSVPAEIETQVKEAPSKNTKNAKTVDKTQEKTEKATTKPSPKAKKSKKPEKYVDLDVLDKAGAAASTTTAPAAASKVTASTDKKPEEHEKGIKAVPAPWANATKAEKPATLTLNEIQKQEAAARAREQKAIDQQKALQRSILFSEASAQAAQEKTRILGTAGWASNGSSGASAVTSPTTVSKTLADIQKEEVSKKQQSAVKKASGTITAAAAAAAAAASGKSDAVSWTLVSGGQSKKSAPAKINYSTLATKAQTPQALRSLSAQPAAVTSSSVNSGSSSVNNSNTNNSVSKQKRQFLLWCRTELKDLNRGVNREELLKMFFQFPCSNDARDLIQDTIYSSSKTINGRRFAEEFIKRRRAIEKHVSSWDDALNQDPDDESEDEWVTTSKKRGRR